MMDPLLRITVLSASRRPDVPAAVECLYNSVQGEIDSRRPACAISGRCCRFEEYGHRLFVTTLELAAFVAGLGEDFMARAGWDGTGCPFQKSRLCTVHPIRPFGCRMFFCDATCTEWQQATYERFHAELKRLHETLSVPYFYLEWRNALKMLGLT